MTGGGLVDPSFPKDFLQRLVDLSDLSGRDRILQSMASPRQLSVRVQGDATVRNDVMKQLEDAGFEPAPVSWFSHAFMLRSGTRTEVQDTSAYRAGHLWIQSLSSMAAVVAMSVEPGHDVLDLCAAPGSKTSLISHLQQGRGILVANDRSRQRIHRLRRNLQQLDVCNCEITCCLGETYGGTHVECFDRVLVDAPCSGEGMMRTSDPASLDQWSIKRIRRLATQQRRLLQSGLRTLRPGGVLVYSTCTYAPEENEEVLDRILTQMGDDFVIEPLPIDLPDAMPGLSSWRESVFHPSIRNCIRLLPGGDMSGFFIARIRRTLS